MNYWNWKAVAYSAAALLLISVSLQSHAASAPVFPAEVDACIQSSACTTPTHIINSQYLQAYRYIDNGVAKYLMHYDLFAPSAQQPASGSSTPFAGAVWLGMQQTYDLAQDRHEINLYLDRVNPHPDPLWLLDSNGLDVILTMTSNDLLAGSGFFNLGETDDYSIFLLGDLGTLGDQGQGGGLYPFGENHSFLPCLAASCEVGATLNLLSIMVVESAGLGVVGFDLTDDRQLLYEQFVGFDGSFLTQTYYAQPVPIPSAVVLLISALGPLFVRRHRNKRE